MNLDKKLFPYPVLKESNNDYENSEIKFDAKIEKTQTMVSFNMNITITDELILKYIEEGKMEYVFWIENSMTKYRIAKKTISPSFDFEISASKLNGIVEMVGFIIAKENIKGYQNPNFNKDYGNSKFLIEKGYVIAISDVKTVEIEKKKEDFKSPKSVFVIIPDSDLQSEYDVVMDDELIKIRLPEKTFLQYKDLVNTTISQNVSFSIFVVPVLVNILWELRNEDARERYQDKKWYKVLNRKISEKLGFPIEDDNRFDNVDLLKLSQQLIDSPIIVAIDDLKKIFEENIKGDDIE